MDKDNERLLGFVLRHYQQGALDTKRAMNKVMRRTGMAVNNSRRTRFAAAAAVLLIVAATAAVWFNHAFGTVVLTADNAVSTVTLPDSTKITLRRGSSLSYNRHNPRAVTLKGTAYFQVRHDEQHPFTVSNDIAQVRVLGTKFVVDAPHTASTTVYVTEGRVRFSAAGAEQGVILTRGMKALLNNGDAMPAYVKPGSPNQTAWATGMFHFDNTPLRDVLSDLNACYGTNLSTNEPDRRLTGDIAADSLADIVDLIEQTLGVDIH